MREVGPPPLRAGQLCANDPVCSEHDPGLAHDERILHSASSQHSASCHGCLLIAEPSCERRNELLDRALVVPTVDTDRKAAFFRDVVG